ncbi:unnamed protein product [Rotaria socialis]
METVETRRMKFGIFMTLQPPSIICYLASIHYILTHRGTRQALHHHGPLVLLFVGLFTVIFDLSMILDFLRTGFVTPRNEGYCIVVCSGACFAFANPILGLYDQFPNSVVPYLLIVIVNVGLWLRIVWQKHYRMRRAVDWRQHRKIIVQFAPVLIVYMFGYLTYGSLECYIMVHGPTDLSMTIQQILSFCNKNYGYIVTSIEKLMSQLRMLESKQPYVNENNLSVRNNRYNFYNNVIISWFYLPLFGEGPAERRKRLQNLISSLYDDEIAKVLRKNEEDDERVEDTKEYHEGLDELQTARCWIAEYSLSMQRAKEHIEKLKEYVAIPEVYRTANIQGL